MFKKIITLLFVLTWCFTLSAQDFMEVSPTLKPVNHDPALEATWDVQFNYDATAITGAAGNAGAVYIPTINKFWTSRWGSGVAHQWNANGTLDLEFTLPFTGTRGMCFDGQYVYHSTNTATVQKVDPVTRTVVGTVPVAGAPNGFRFITYNPDGNSGAGSIIGGNWTAPNLSFYEFSLTGTLLRTITSTVTGVYGLAYDNWSAGGPFLWVWSQGAGAGTPQLIQQMNYTAGTYTGVTHDVITDVGVGNASAIAGGLFITDQLVPGFVTLGGMLQGTPDKLFGYELATVSSGNTYFEDFETFVAGQQLACQDPTNWTTWSNAPCGNEDALISTNYAFSGTKSALIDWVAPRYVDLVKPLGGKTAGTWYVDFMAYIPAGKYGYYNILADFAGASSLWAFQAYFNAGGTGTIDAGGASAATFTYPHDAWFAVQFKVDLDADQAQFWVNGTSVYTWQYTLGTFGTPVPKVLDASDIFAPNAVAANNAMYIDNFYFSDQPFIPVELTSFIANVNTLGQVVLNWETATEVNNQGFEIERRTETSEYRTIGFVEGFGTTTEPKSYIYTDVTAENGINYYRLKQVDFNGTYEYSSEIEVDVTGPLTFDLAQNYPNPFNPSTSIKYSVPESGNIRLSVFNIVGEEVAVLVDGFSQAGFYEVTFDASNLSTGVYLYKLQSANSVQTKKMMLLK